MSTSSELRNRVGTYFRSHPREVRLLAFLAVLCMVWMLAPSIESLIHGFLDGLQEPGSR